MSGSDFIEPSLADAPALRLEVDQGGTVRYVVHGIVRTYSFQLAQDLLADRRVRPREHAPPAVAINYGREIFHR